MMRRAAPPTSTPPGREVVAVVVTWRGRLGLFRRSDAVAWDAGRWHCITGYVEAAETALHGAVRELFEETGLAVHDLAGLRAGPTLDLADHQGRSWTVHTFVAESARRRLRLDAEHDTYRWVCPSRLARFDGRVAWLDDVLAAVGVGPGAGRVPALDLRQTVEAH